MAALTLLPIFATPDEFRAVIPSCLEVIDFALRAYKNAYSQEDHQTTLFHLTYAGSLLLQYLIILAAADYSVVERLVRFDGLEVISMALQGDPNREKPFKEALYGTELLWYILVAEKRKHVQRIRKETAIIECMLTTLHFFFYILVDVALFPNLIVKIELE